MKRKIEKTHIYDYTSILYIPYRYKFLTIDLHTETKWIKKKQNKID